MTREEALKLLGGVLQGYLLKDDINQIYNDHEAQLKAKDDEIRRLNNLYADTIKDLGEVLMEIERLEEYYLRSKKSLQAKGKRMKTEQEDNILNYFFKKSLCGMVLYVRVTSKYDQRNSTVIKCNEEQALDFLLSVKNKL